MWIIACFIIDGFGYFRHLSAFENMALGRTVWEENPWPSSYEGWQGDKAVDGRFTDRSPHGGQCLISNNYARTATWGVDLGGVVSISHIDIYYRTDNLPRPTAHTSRMAGFFLYVTNTTSKEDGRLCFHEIQTRNGTPSEDQRINCSVQGRYVIYYNERLPNVTYPSYYSTYAYYDLCELEVYGCSNVGYYGQSCNIPCPTHCQEKRCDVNTGKCLGCLPGYLGPTCSQVCDQQAYGMDSLQSCGNCSNEETCHHVNGICLHGCNEGVQGWMCKSECKPGQYGRDCAYNCSENCHVTRRCNRFTGECNGGCKAGWTGATCDQKCGGGYFGPRCERRCGHCRNTTQCHHVDGSCPNGCFAGYIRQVCEKRICDDRCKRGWAGPICEKDPPRFGDKNPIVISTVVTVTIVLSGSVLNFVYWKRSKEKKEDYDQYSELQEVVKSKPYEKFQMYAN